ncbi:MAG TPA: S8 family serine peptidase, partial [Pseudolabrys sp.]|nr:S8 family serine peptidase [Pseudolabrys sp.]
MRRLAAVIVVLLAAGIGAVTPALAQGVGVGGGATPVPVVTRSFNAVTPLGVYAIGSIACAAVSPMIGTAILGREMTASEVGHSTLTCMFGPAGWLLAEQLFPAVAVTAIHPGPPGQPTNRPQRGRNIRVPPPGAPFVKNEVLLEFTARVPAQYLDRLAQRLQLTRLETQNFSLTGRALQRWRIDGTRSVPDTLRALGSYGRVAAAQPNYLFALQQSQSSTAAQDSHSTQYVVSKLHLIEAHRITNGDDVVVAVIDSGIDSAHPDLAGVFAGDYDVIGAPAAPHSHGTGMAGAIAAHAKLIGVAPKVKLLAVRAFAGTGSSADGTTFNILKGLDWAASHAARVVNMSFAGPDDPMLRDMLAKASTRNIVLVAAVGNAGPQSTPLYPAADAHVIGVTAIDADDHLLT